MHAAGLLKHLTGAEPIPKKIWEAIQTLFAAMNEVQELLASRFGQKTKVVSMSSPGYANMPPALQFVHAILILIAEGNAWRLLMAAPNFKSELTQALVDVSRAMSGFYELADILIVQDEALCLRCQILHDSLSLIRR